MRFLPRFAFLGTTIDVRRNDGDDLREGNPPLPLIHVMRHGSDTERALVRSAIEQGQTNQFDAIMAAVISTGALEFTRQRARDEADAGQAALALLPESPYRQALMTIADMSVARDR